MATKIETLLVSLEARINQYEKTMARSVGIAAKTAGGIEARFNRMSQNVNSSFQNMLRNGAAFAGGALGVREIAAYADAWTEAGNKIRAAGTAAGVQTRSLDELKSGANAARTSLADYVDLYARLIRSASGVAKSEQEIATATDIVSKAFKAGGASASEQASGILQLGQALGSGVLQGDELRSLRENAPVIAQAIANEFGVTIAGLKQLGAEGKLTSERVFQAILKAQANVESQFKATNGTIADSFTVLKNNLTSYIGTMAETLGITATANQILAALAGNITSVANAAAAAAIVLTAAFGARSALAAVGALANPFVLAAAAIGAAAYALTAFSDQLGPVKESLRVMGDYAGAAWDMVSEKVGFAGQVITDVFSALAGVLGTMMDAAVTGIVASFEYLASFTLDVADTIVNAFTTAYDALVVTFTALPAAIAESVVSAMNYMVGIIEGGINAVISGVNKAIGALNSLGSFVGVDGGLGEVGAVTLGRIENSYAGAGTAAGKAYAAAFAADGAAPVRDALAALRSNAGARGLDRRQGALDGRLDGTPALLPSQNTSGLGGAPAAGGGGGGGKGKKAKQDELAREIEQIKEKTAALQGETAAQAGLNPLINDYGFAVTKAKTAQDLLTAAKKAGIAVTPELKEKIDALAEGYANATVEAAKLAESQEKIKQSAEDMKALGKDVLDGFISDIANGKSAAEALEGALGKIADKLLDIALNAVFDNLFRGSGSSGGGLFGSIGKLFGFASGTANTGGRRGEPRGIVHGQEAVIPLGAGGKIPIQMPSDIISSATQPASNVSTTQFNIDARGAVEGTADQIRKALVEYDKTTAPQTAVNSIQRAQKYGKIR